MKRQMIGISLLAGLAVLLGFQTEDLVEQAIVQLRQQVADLGLRVGRLEHAGGSAQPAGRSGTAMGAPARSMVVDGIHQSDHTDDNSKEIDQLKRQVTSLQSTVTEKQESVNKASGQAVRGRTTGSGWQHTSDREDINQQIESKRETANLYATQLSIKKQKLQRLQHADSEPKQIIHGREGKVIVTLQSKFNLTESLNNIDIGDTVTWTGSRVSVDDGSETWMIDTIRKVPAK